MSARYTAVCLILLLLLTPVLTSHAQVLPEWDAAAETAVIFNSDFPGSAELAAYYAAQRNIPPERVIGLHCPAEDSVSREQFEDLIRKPLLKTFQKRGWTLSQPLVTGATPAEGSKAAGTVAATLRVLVLMRGMPFQVRRSAPNPKPSEEDEASVDAELTVLGVNAPAAKGGVNNPYFEKAVRFPYARRTTGIMIVGRLDGPDDETVRRMIDDAIHAEKEGLLGRAVIDQALKGGPYQPGEDWLKSSAELLKRAGIPVYLDRAEGLIPDGWPLPDTILYFGWYTDRVSGALAAPDFRFKRGALACHLHSYSASVIRTKDKAWVGPLLAKGAAVTFGNVFEPYLTLTIHFDVLNKRLLEGYTVGEAAWNATPALSWMNVVLGDPLYRPFARGAGATLGEGAERDYALYQGVVRRMAADTDAQIKTAITELAQKRESPRLLELTALLSSLQQKDLEAADLLEHAESTTRSVDDLLRLRLYRAEMLQRGQMQGAARGLLRETIEDQRFKKAPDKAVRLLLERLGG